MAKIRWEVSKDGKTVTAEGKTYSISAFKNQFQDIKSPYISGRGDAILKPGIAGVAETTGRKVVTPKVDSSPDKAKSRAEKKRYDSSIKKMNEALQARKAGGITDSGAKKNVNPVYRNMGRGGLGGLLGKLPK